MRTKSLKKNKINVITLGCSKNVYDSEVLMGQLRASGKRPDHRRERGRALLAHVETGAALRAPHLHALVGDAPLIELYVVYKRVAAVCAERGITIARNLVGSYITSLEMAGCSITLLKLDDELTRLWDAPVNTPALRWGA